MSVFDLRVQTVLGEPVRHRDTGANRFLAVIRANDEENVIPGAPRLLDRVDHLGHAGVRHHQRVDMRGRSERM